MTTWLRDDNTHLNGAETTEPGDSSESELHDLLAAANQRVTALEVTVKTFLHDLDEFSVNNETTMSPNMWLQIMAFKKLVGG